jgi:hypothetical protein
MDMTAVTLEGSSRGSDLGCIALGGRLYVNEVCSELRDMHEHLFVTS